MLKILIRKENIPPKKNKMPKFCLMGKKVGQLDLHSIHVACPTVFFSFRSTQNLDLQWHYGALSISSGQRKTPGASCSKHR